MGAVPKKKPTRSKSNIRRNSQARRKALPELVRCTQCGKLRKPHIACTHCGFYKN